MKGHFFPFAVVFVLLASLLGQANNADAGVNSPEGAPAVVSYQGQITLSGQPYNGIGYFKFAIVNQAGNTSYWSNDGTSTGGNQPVAYLQISVTGGLFNVFLGDAGQSPLTASVFSGTQRYLRVWFGTDTSTFTQLSPDQAIVSVPYAMQSQEAANAFTLNNQQGSFYLDASNINAGTLADARLSSNIARMTQIFPTVLANDGAGSTLDADLLDGQNGSFYQDASNINAGTLADARLSFNIARLSQIMPTVLANDGAGSTLDADLLDGQNGSFYQNASNLNTGTLSTNLYSAYTDLNNEGYLDNSGAGDLLTQSQGNERYMPSAHSLIRGWTTTVDTAGTVGDYTSITIGADGLGLISYYDLTNTDLKVLHCGNPSCSAGNTITIVDTTTNVGYSTSIVIGADGLGLISYYDSGNGDLKVLHCGNLLCNSGNTYGSVDSVGNVGRYPSITIGTDGLGLISYYDVTNADLKVLHCGDTACSTGNTITSVDTQGNVGAYTSITVGVDGLGLISYFDWTNYDLKVLHCGDFACSEGNISTSVDMPGSVGYSPSITIGVDGLGLISYMDSIELKVLHCGNLVCNSGNIISVVDTLEVLSYFISITIGSDGLGLISYTDEIFDLKLLHCGNFLCSTGNTISKIETKVDVLFASITTGMDGLGLMSYYELTNGDLKVAKLVNAGRR